jgi:hypothetical protein
MIELLLLIPIFGMICLASYYANKEEIKPPPKKEKQMFDVTKPNDIHLHEIYVDFKLLNDLIDQEFESYETSSKPLLVHASYKEIAEVYQLRKGWNFIPVITQAPGERINFGFWEGAIIGLVLFRHKTKKDNDKAIEAFAKKHKLLIMKCKIEYEVMKRAGRNNITPKELTEMEFFCKTGNYLKINSEHGHFSTLNFKGWILQKLFDTIN